VTSFTDELDAESIWHQQRWYTTAWQAVRTISFYCLIKLLCVILNQCILTFLYLFSSALMSWSSTTHFCPVYFYASDLHREGALWNYGWCLCVCLSVHLSVCHVPRPNLRMERPRKPKICTMEAHHTINPWTYLRSKDQSHQAD